MFDIRKCSVSAQVVAYSGVRSILAVLAVPKNKILKASSRESEFNRKLFHAKPN